MLIQFTQQCLSSQSIIHMPRCGRSPVLTISSSILLDKHSRMQPLELHPIVLVDKLVLSDVCCYQRSILRSMIEIDRRLKLYSIWPVVHLLSRQLLPGRLHQSNYEQASPNPRISFKEGVGVIQSGDCMIKEIGKAGWSQVSTPWLSSAACFKDLTPSITNYYSGP